MMKQRSFFYFLAVSAVVLLLTGIGGCNWLARKSADSAPEWERDNSRGCYVHTETGTSYGVFTSKSRPHRRTAAIALGNKPAKTSLLANTGLDYRRDIQPWLGNEITVAVSSIDIDHDVENGQQTGYLMALATVNPAKSREFLELLFSKRAIAGTALVSEQYKGVKLIYDKQNPQDQSTAKSEGKLSGAVVGDRFVLLANDPKVLKDAINNVQAPGLNLTNSSQYQQALTLLPRRIGVTFLNLPSLAMWRGLQLAQTYQSQIVALELKPQGLLVETSLLSAAKIQENLLSAPDLSQPVGALQYIPSETGFSISGSDLSRYKKLADYPTISRLVNQPLADLQTRWGIDLPRDILAGCKANMPWECYLFQTKRLPIWFCSREIQRC
jgi:hypothetical protein